MSTLIWLVIMILIFCLIIWLLDQFPMPANMRLAVRLIVVLIAILVLLDRLGLFNL